MHNAAPPDWSAIDTVLLDMDGTLLDLSFDNHFWQEQVPARFAAANGLDLETARARLAPLFAARRGTLQWYCLDYWTRELALDLEALKREVRGQVQWLPRAEAFLSRLRLRLLGKRIALVTNAHPVTLEVKNEQLHFAGHFDAVYSSHPFGAPKESAQFWPRLAAAERFDASRTLFVDDSPAVLQAARLYGIRWVYGIARPDSTRPRTEMGSLPAVDAVGELMPG